MIWNRRRVRPGDLLGVRVSSERVSKGTFGCVVKRFGRKYILTCEHVFEGVGQGASVFSVDPVTDTPKIRVGTVAELSGFSSRSNANTHDHLLVEIRRGAPVKSRFPKPIGKLSTEAVGNPRVRDLAGTPVQMIGGKSGYVNGEINGIFRVTTWGGPSVRTPVYEVFAGSQRGTSVDFGMPGDSGALILTDPQRNGGQSRRPMPVCFLIGIVEPSESRDDRPPTGPIIGRGYAISAGRVLDKIRESDSAASILRR